jgi:hypothetical protein
MKITIGKWGIKLNYKRMGMRGFGHMGIGKEGRGMVVGNW